jgi:hypothetical protein
MEAMPYILKGVILPLAVGGVVAYLYPGLRAYFKKPLSYRRIRVDMLLDDYRTTRRYTSDTSFLITHLVFHLASLLGQLAVLILATGIHLNSLFGDFLGFILYGFIATSCLVQVNRIHNIIHNSTAFNTYREKVIADLKRLGGNPEDLDKEETEKQGIYDE